jgi:hypothetical protein
LVKTAVAVCSILFSLTASAVGCSLLSCSIKDAEEFRSTFVVRVTHGGQPVPEVKIEITGGPEAVIKGITSADGQVPTPVLRPGLYWIRAEKLGIWAGYQCFQIKHTATRRARKTVDYDWGDLAPTYSRINGIVTRMELGKDASPILRLIHQIEVPAPAQLKLTNAFSAEEFKATSLPDGTFAFPTLPEGTYVLHADTSDASSDTVVKIGSDGKSDPMHLAVRQSGCGGNYIEFR